MRSLRTGDNCEADFTQERQRHTAKACNEIARCVADGALKVGAVVTAEGELLAVFHDDAVFAVKPGLHFLDPVDLHNRRAMNAPELLWVELLFQTADRLAQQIAFLVIVDAHVVSFRLDAVNVLHVKKEDATAVLDHESLEMTRSTLQLFQQRKNVTVSFAALIEFDLFLDALPGGVESFVIERLEQVVEGMHLKGAHGILIVGSDKDDVRSRSADRATPALRSRPARAFECPERRDPAVTT